MNRRAHDPEEFDPAALRSERGAPWWSRSIWVLGPTAVIALLLVWGVVTGRLALNVNGKALAGDGKEVQRALEQTHQLMQEHKAQTERVIDLLRDNAQTQKENQAIQRRICRGVAKSETTKEECDR